MGLFCYRSWLLWQMHAGLQSHADVVRFHGDLPLLRVIEVTQGDALSRSVKDS